MTFRFSSLTPDTPVQRFITRARLLASVLEIRGPTLGINRWANKHEWLRNFLKKTQSNTNGPLTWGEGGLEGWFNFAQYEIFHGLSVGFPPRRTAIINLNVGIRGDEMMVDSVEVCKAGLCAGNSREKK